MKRIYKFCGLAAIGSTLPFLYKPIQNAFISHHDEIAEGLTLNRTATEQIATQLADMAMFSVTKERELANDIALHFNTRLGKIQTSNTGKGHETKIQFMESIRDKRIFLICSFDTNRWTLNETLIDLFLTIAAAKRSSPVEVNVVLPYYAYCRQNSPDGSHRKSVFASDIAILLEAAGADKVFTVNMHKSHIHGSFHVPVLDVDASTICAKYFKEYQFKDLVLVVTNDRLFNQAAKIQKALQKTGRKVDLGILASETGKSDSKYNYIGKDLKDRDVLMIDNIIDTAKTTKKASDYISQLGARDIYMFAVHGILGDGAVDRIDESCIKELVITNTLPLNMTKMSPKINQVSIAEMLAETMSQATFNRTLEQLIAAKGVTALHKNFDE